VQVLAAPSTSADTGSRTGRRFEAPSQEVRQMSSQEPDLQEPIIPPTRSKALADGVFSIAMTLLVLDLGVPVVTQSSGDGALEKALLEMWPDFAFYVLSFLILGIFWLIHRVIFDVIMKYDTTLVWLNILYLMFVVLIPFSTSLFARYPTQQTATIVYGANVLLMFLMGFAMFSYAAGGHRLVDPTFDPVVIRGARIMGYVYIAVLLSGIAISFVSPLVSTLVYGAQALVILVFTIVGKADIVFTGGAAERRRRQSGGS
jgi:uncharacterized membrane protein